LHATGFSQASASSPHASSNGNFTVARSGYEWRPFERNVCEQDVDHQQRFEERHPPIFMGSSPQRNCARIFLHA
jgi:hypothetical protein